MHFLHRYTHGVVIFFFLGMANRTIPVFVCFAELFSSPPPPPGLHPLILNKIYEILKGIYDILKEIWEFLKDIIKGIKII